MQDAFGGHPVIKSDGLQVMPQYAKIPLKVITHFPFAVVPFGDVGHFPPTFLHGGEQNLPSISGTKLTSSDPALHGPSLGSG